MQKTDYWTIVEKSKTDNAAEYEKVKYYDFNEFVEAMKRIQNLEDHLVDKDNAEIEKQLKNNPLYKHTTKERYWVYKNFPDTETNIFNEFLGKIKEHETEPFKQIAIDFYLNSGLEYPLQPKYENYSELREASLLIHTGCRFAKSYLLKTGLSPKEINFIPELKISNVNEKYRDKHGIQDDFYSKYDEGQNDGDNNNDDNEHLNQEQQDVVRDERTFNDNDKGEEGEDVENDDNNEEEDLEQEGTRNREEEESDELDISDTSLTSDEIEENKRNKKQRLNMRESCEEILWQSFFCHKNNKVHCFERLIYNDRITNLYRKRDDKKKTSGEEEEKVKKSKGEEIFEYPITCFYTVYKHPRTCILVPVSYQYVPDTNMYVPIYFRTERYISDITKVVDGINGKDYVLMTNIDNKYAHVRSRYYIDVGVKVPNDETGIVEIRMHREDVLKQDIKHK